MMTPKSSNEIVVELDGFRNDLAGVLSFTLGVTALQFDRPSPVALISLFFVLTWVTVKLAPWRSDHEVFYNSLGRWKGRRRAFNSNLIFFIGMVFLASIAFDFLTLADLEILDLSKPKK